MINLKLILSVITVLAFVNLSSHCQSTKVKYLPKVPKYSISFMGGFGYVLSKANGDAKGFTSAYNLPGGNLFNSKNLGMQQGYGLMAIGKAAINKKRNLRLTGSLGYNLFYNSEDRGMNRTKWNLINLGAGVEYTFNPKQKERLYVGYEIDYTVLFGAWQTDYTYPDNSVSNIYTRFKPTSRFGMAVTTGMEFRLNKKMDFVVAIRGVWVNVIPKQNFYSGEAYSTYINDSGSSNGIEFDGKKNIIYMQVTAGVTLPISFK